MSHPPKEHTPQVVREFHLRFSAFERKWKIQEAPEWDGTNDDHFVKVIEYSAYLSLQQELERMTDMWTVAEALKEQAEKNEIYVSSKVDELEKQLAKSKIYQDKIAEHNIDLHAKINGLEFELDCKMKTAQAEPREFYIQKTLVTVGAKVEAMYKVYLQMPDNAASNEYNHGDIYFHVIEISAVEALKSQNSILKQQIAELNEDIRQDYIDSATRERELVKKLDDMSQVGLKNLELESQLKLAVKGLEFECGNICAEQNPCNAKETLKKLRGEG